LAAAAFLLGQARAAAALEVALVALGLFEFLVVGLAYLAAYFYPYLLPKL
jgi:hypothetical protein